MIFCGTFPNIIGLYAGPYAGPPGQSSAHRTLALDDVLEVLVTGVSAIMDKFLLEVNHHIHAVEVRSHTLDVFRAYAINFETYQRMMGRQRVLRCNSIRCCKYQSSKGSSVSTASRNTRDLQPASVLQILCRVAEQSF